MLKKLALLLKSNNSTQLQYLSKKFVANNTD